jgi:hypothetical protein
MTIEQEEILNRAKANCKNAGHRWDSNEEKAPLSGQFSPKTGALIDEAGRQRYLTEAHRQLLEEEEKKSTAQRPKG